MAASSASGHCYHQLHHSVAHPQPHHFFTRPRRDTPFPQRGKPPAPQSSSSSPSPSPSSSSWGYSSPHKTTARASSTAPATNGWTSTATTATTSQPYWAVKIEKEYEADRVEDGEEEEEEEEGDDEFSGEEEEEERYDGGGGSDVEEEDERGEEGEVIDLAYDIEDDKMVWSHQSRSDSDEEEDVEEFEDDAEDHDKGEGCGPGKTPNLCSGDDDHVVGAASDSPWLERGSESGSSEVRAATSTRSAQDKDWDEGGGYDVGADDQEVNDGDSSDEEEEEEGTTTDHYSQSQPPPSSAPAVDVPAPAAPAAAQEGDLSGGYPTDYLGLAGEGDQDALAFDCDFLLELLRAEELNNGECDMGVAAAPQQQQPLQQQHHSHLQQQHQQHPDPPQRQTHHHGSSTWSRPDQGQGRGEADGSTLKQLLESYRGQQPYAQAHTQAQALHDDQSPQAQVEGASCASAVAGGMVSTTKTLAQLFGLPQPLYLSASNPSTTLSALEALNQHRRRSKTREAAVVLPPSLTPFLSQMTAYLTPSIADPQEDGSTATGGSPTTKRKSTVTYAPLPLPHAEAKRARAEASDHLAAHQRNLMYGGHQLQEDVASHMEGETGGGHIDSLLTYLDSPMSISFDASSTPCSTPSSPFSPTHQPQHHHHHLLHDSLLRGPATADPHRVAGQPHHRPLVEYAREALRTCGTASTLTSTMTTASPAQAQPTTDADADIDSDFLEEVMQFATQLEQDLLS